MMNTISWSVWSLFFSFITLLNLYFFFLELRDKGYRKHILIKIVIFILCFILYCSILLPFYLFSLLPSYLAFFLLLYFHFSIFIVFIILRKFITFNDITLFFMLSLILFPISYNIGSKIGATDGHYEYFWNFDIMILLFISIILFFINLVMQISNYDTRKQQSENKDKPNES